MLTGAHGFYKRIRIEFEVVAPVFDIEVTTISSGVTPATQSVRATWTGGGTPEATGGALSIVTGGVSTPWIPSAQNSQSPFPALVFPSRPLGYGEFFGGGAARDSIVPGNASFLVSPQTNQWSQVNMDNGHRQIIIQNLGNSRIIGRSNTVVGSIWRSSWESQEAAFAAGDELFRSPFIVTRDIHRYQLTDAAYAHRTYHRLRPYVNDYMQIWVRPRTDLPVGVHRDYLILRGEYGYEVRIPVQFTVLPPNVDGIISVSPMSWIFTSRDYGYRLTHGIDTMDTYRTGFAQFNIANFSYHDIDFIFNRYITGSPIEGWTEGQQHRGWGGTALPVTPAVESLMLQGTGSVAPLSGSTIRLERDTTTTTGSPFVIYRGLYPGHGRNADNTVPFGQAGSQLLLAASGAAVNVSPSAVDPTFGNIRVMPRLGLAPGTYTDYLIIEVVSSSGAILAYPPVRIPLTFVVHDRGGVELLYVSQTRRPAGNR